MRPSVQILDPSRHPALVALILGIAATVFAVILLAASKVWLALAAAGAFAIVLSFVLLDPLDYWLGALVLALPYNISKLLFMSPAGIDRLKEDLGIADRGFEVLVPLLFAFDLPFAILLGFLAARTLASRRPLIEPKPLVLAVLFLLWCGVTLLGAPVKLLGVTWIFYGAHMLILALVVVNVVRARRTLTVTVAALLAGLALQAVLTGYSFKFQVGENLFGSLFGQKKWGASTPYRRGWGAASIYEDGSLLRGTGSIGAGNEQAKYFVLCLPVALAAFLVGRERSLRLLAAVSFLGGAGALYLTYSRGGLISASFALAVTLLLLRHRGIVSRKAFLRLAVFGLLGLAAAMPKLYDYFTTRPRFFDLRFRQIRAAIDIALDQPLTGLGINNFNVAVSPESHGGIFSIPVHNHYIRLWCETGLIGVALYLAFFASILRVAYRASAQRDPFLAGFAAALFGALCGIVLYWSDDIFYGVLIRAHIWLFIGLILAIAELGREEAEHAARAAPA